MERAGFQGFEGRARFHDYYDDYYDDYEYSDSPLSSLLRAVGGHEALYSLSIEPLPDEDFDWTGIPDDIHDVVADLLGRCDQACAALFDVEARTACRRLLAMVARHGPAVVRRKAKPERTAAALCWLIGNINELYGPKVKVKDLTASFGVRGAVTSRARTIVQALGHDGWWYRTAELGLAELLVSSRRRQLISLRDGLPA
jgi:hypothetical protein